MDRDTNAVKNILARGLLHLSTAGHAGNSRLRRDWISDATNTVTSSPLVERGTTSKRHWADTMMTRRKPLPKGRGDVTRRKWSTLQW